MRARAGERARNRQRISDDTVTIIAQVRMLAMRSLCRVVSKQFERSLKAGRAKHWPAALRNVLTNQSRGLPLAATTLV